MSVSGRGTRIKGKRLENEVTKRLCDIGIVAKRVPLSGALAWLKGDVTEFTYGTKHVHECKNCEILELPAWWRQTTSQVVNDGEIPILHFTSNYQKVHTVMRVGDFDELVFEYEQLHKELSLTVADFPKRKNFWKFLKEKPSDIFMHTIDDDEVVVFGFDLYLKLRKATVSANPETSFSPGVQSLQPS